MANTMATKMGQALSDRANSSPGFAGEGKAAFLGAGGAGGGAGGGATTAAAGRSMETYQTLEVREKRVLSSGE